MNARTPKAGRWRRPLVLWPVAGLVLVLVAAGLWAFQPWRLFTTRTVEEPPPAAASAPSAPDGEGRANGEDGEDRDGGEAGGETEPVVLAGGEFITQEHDTSGTVTVLELPDGSRHVRLEDLATSDGPDLHVWITDQEAGGDWSKYRDGRYVALGELKGTHGSANYEIPADADISGMTSVVIWCDRFSVAFGSAPVDL
ncbi:DM13 domain-containing protein [Nocardiopsis sp. EMB25]|uniref:DM13 domain-containing protein n=1 Tax=Nocardiopsis TaxID=2013 RepID=UPI00034DA91A|nr:MULTISPECIES: DM13 domain-containing protein [Nocardiopsis]MCY9785554.1 DM13 domain-containing protein [Nocardiopsis sp. EMB25]